MHFANASAEDPASGGGEPEPAAPPPSVALDPVALAALTVDVARARVVLVPVPPGVAVALVELPPQPVIRIPPASAVAASMPARRMLGRVLGCIESLLVVSAGSSQRLYATGGFRPVSPVAAGCRLRVPPRETAMKPARGTFT
jgi:hypothetical protein